MIAHAISPHWQAYFNACKTKDLKASSVAMINIGMRPVPIGADPKTGKIKIPQGLGWGVSTNDDRLERLDGLITSGKPVGIGCQADGYVVLDIDPPGKDRKRIAKTVEEAAAILLGSEKWPETFVVATEGGCHVWFKTTLRVQSAWADKGKQVLKLPSGGMVEFFTGNKSQMQVACPPSAGKAIAEWREPAYMPEGVEDVLLNILNPRPVASKPPVSVDHVSASGKKGVFDAELKNSVRKVSSAAEGNRHKEYISSIRWIGGYASALGLTDLKDTAFLALSAAHQYAKPEVTGYVLENAFESLWAIGVEQPITNIPMLEEFSQTADIILSEEDATHALDIRGLMKNRQWVWGDQESNTGWFVQRGLHLVEGKEGTGKTRWLMDLVRRWSKGLEWPDGSACTMDADSKVLFVAADSHWDQIAMCGEAFGIPDENVIFTGPKSDPYGFTSIDDPATIAYIRKWCGKYKVGMVVIDTLMAASSRPLVDPQEVAKIAGPLRELARDCNVAIVLVGHLNGQGETWGRSMGRTCDNVIRMEADPSGRRITIKSVKARWHYQDLPVLNGVQSDIGWTYGEEATESLQPENLKGRAAVEIELYNYVYSSEERPSWNEMQGAMQHAGYKRATISRAIQDMVANGIMLKMEHEYAPGKISKVYDIKPQP